MELIIGAENWYQIIHQNRYDLVIKGDHLRLPSVEKTYSLKPTNVNI